MAADLPTRLRLLAHPVTTGALALLVVNDRVLKPWAAGLTGPLDAPADLLTGKLSDVAGVLLVALLAGVVTGRRRATLIAVALAFTALKLSPTVADLASPVLGGTTRTDPTDLLALLIALPIADRFLLRATGATDPTPAPDDAPTGPSQVASVARRTPAPVLTALVLVLTVPAVTATSCNEPTPLDDGPCYRVTTDDEGRGLVEEGVDGRWTTAFAHSDEEWRRMELRANDCSGTATEGDGFRSVTVVDDTVLVAMGSQGVLRRDAGGGWERIAVGGAVPSGWPPPPPSGWPPAPPGPPG